MSKFIFKFDDYRGASREVRKIDRFVRWLGVRITWGIIGSDAAKWGEREIAWAKSALDSGLYCFWNHGWSHAFNEFKELSEVESVKHLQDTQRVVREKLGIELETFGAPCNAFNERMRAALEAIPELKCWYYGEDSFSGRNYPRKLELEYPLFHPSAFQFIKSYRMLGRIDAVYVLQGHPEQWNFRSRLQFYMIALYLKLTGAEFVFPGRETV